MPALEIFKNDCIVPESSYVFNYATQKLVTISLENNAKKLVDSKFVKLDEHLYKYNHTNGQTSKINLSNRTCTCPETIDKGISLHLIGVAYIEKFLCFSTYLLLNTFF